MGRYGMSIVRWYFPRDRLSRRAYWQHYFLPILLTTIAASLVDAALGFGRPSPDITPGPGVTISGDVVLTHGLLSGGPLENTVFLLALIPSIAAVVTRLHDTGRSGAWFALLAVVGPSLGGTLAFIAAFMNAGVAAVLFFAVLGGVIYLIVLLCLRGDTQPNSYGPPPGQMPQPPQGYQPPADYGPYRYPDGR